MNVTNHSVEVELLGRIDVYSQPDSNGRERCDRPKTGKDPGI